MLTASGLALNVPFVRTLCVCVRMGVCVIVCGKCSLEDYLTRAS